jgi:hypothetical protein
MPPLFSLAVPPPFLFFAGGVPAPLSPCGAGRAVCAQAPHVRPPTCAGGLSRLLSPAPRLRNHRHPPPPPAQTSAWYGIFFTLASAPAKLPLALPPPQSKTIVFDCSGILQSRLCVRDVVVSGFSRAHRKGYAQLTGTFHPHGWESAPEPADVRLNN